MIMALFRRTGGGNWAQMNFQLGVCYLCKNLSLFRPLFGQSLQILFMIIAADAVETDT